MALEPWAVPCGNDWMKRNWNKWQGKHVLKHVKWSCVRRGYTVQYRYRQCP